MKGQDEPFRFTPNTELPDEDVTQDEALDSGKDVNVKESDEDGRAVERNSKHVESGDKVKHVTWDEV